MSAVESPTTNTTWCPSSWKAFSLRSETAWPTCRSGRVGSKPCFTVRGWPERAERSSLRTISSSGTISSAPRRISSICSATGGKCMLTLRFREREAAV